MANARNTEPAPDGGGSSETTKALNADMNTAVDNPATTTKTTGGIRCDVPAEGAEGNAR